MSGNEMGKRVRKEDNLFRKGREKWEEKERINKEEEERKDRRWKAILTEERGRKRR
jgi:hypothetical protein